MARPPLSPNQITTSRILVFVAGSALLLFDHTYWWGIALFIVGGATDRLDGWVARRYGLCSQFGKIYDQLSDKICLLFALTAMVQRGMLPLWLLAALLMRDLVMGGLREWSTITRGEPLGANWFGKRKADIHWISFVAFLIFAPLFPAHAAPMRTATIAVTLFASYASLFSYLIELRSAADLTLSSSAADRPERDADADRERRVSVNGRA
jgi:CDP-diacylglycerol--glycerol-3-phosphate 3-phosphatidyltransferase